MSLFSDPLVYIFYPNPANASWDSPKALTLLIVCGLLVFSSFAIKRWRRKLQNPITKKLSKSWSKAAFWFGAIGLFLVLARLETISYVSMRLWWFFWGIALVAYLLLQLRLYKARHYEVLPADKQKDPRDQYLPNRKK